MPELTYKSTFLKNRILVLKFQLEHGEHSWQVDFLPVERVAGS